MINFRGGELDGQTKPGPTEDEWWADWDPTEDCYVVTDEDGEEKGRLRFGAFQVQVTPRPPLRAPRKFWQEPLNLAYGLAMLAVLVNLASAFFSQRLHIAILAVAFGLLLVAFFLKPLD